MRNIWIHIIYLIIVIGASYLFFRSGRRTAQKAVKQVKLLKAELKRISKRFPILRLASISPEAGRISLRIINVSEETIILDRVTAKTESFYENPDDRSNYKFKQYKPFEFNKYLLSPDKTVSIEFFLNPIKHFREVDFTLKFKYYKGKRYWITYRLLSAKQSIFILESK